jgi:hypothetical protein
MRCSRAIREPPHRLHDQRPLRAGTPVHPLPRRLRQGGGPPGHRPGPAGPGPWPTPWGGPGGRPPGRAPPAWRRPGRRPPGRSRPGPGGRTPAVAPRPPPCPAWGRRPGRRPARPRARPPRPRPGGPVGGAGALVPRGLAEDLRQPWPLLVVQGGAALGVRALQVGDQAGDGGAGVGGLGVGQGGGERLQEALAAGEHGAEHGRADLRVGPQRPQADAKPLPQGPPFPRRMYGTGYVVSRWTQ